MIKLICIISFLFSVSSFANITLYKNIKEKENSLNYSCKNYNLGNTNEIKLLLFTKTEAFRHKSIPKAISTITKIAKDNGWKIEATENASVFNSKKLQKFNVLIFANTTGDILNKKQQIAFEEYIKNGGGYVGIHSASDTEHTWPFYAEMVGAQFKNHPKVQTATLNVNQKNVHPSIAHLGETFQHTDEWYNFKKPVAEYVNVLLDLDESTYDGPHMGIYHPIAWFHEFKGGKVFYTGMGHTNEAYDVPEFTKHITEGIRWASSTENKLGKVNKKVTTMFDKDLSKWDVWMGAVHSTVDLPGVEKTDNVIDENAKPLGLNKDPKNVFSVNENGELYVTGEIYGGLTTKKEYENYHLKVEFKWGEKKWEPRLKDKRDSGLLYHCKGEHGKFWNVWKQSLEFQVQESDCGDFIALGDVFGDVPSIQKKRDNGNVYRVFEPKGELAPVKWGAFPTGQVAKFPLNENPNGEWNTLEIIVIGDKSIHLVNGTLVNAVVNARFGKPGNTVPVTKGQIQIQSEAAEVYYKNMTITENLEDFPENYKKQLGW